MYGNDAHQVISNKKITVKAVNSLGIVKWTCGSAGLIPDRCLPSACR